VTSNLLIREPSEITAAWLSKALDPPGLALTDVQIQPMPLRQSAVEADTLQLATAP
jgi:hypothetical protein